MRALPAGLPADAEPDALATSDTSVATSERGDRDDSPAYPGTTHPSTQPPPPSQVVLVLTDEDKRDGNLAGADDPTASDAGDKALPLDLLEPPENDVLRSTADRAKLWARLNNAKLRKGIHDHYVFRKKSAPDVAEDLTTLAFLRGMQAKSWPDDPLLLFCWLRRCANYVFLESFRSEKRRAKYVENSDDLEHHGEHPEDGLERRYELRQRLNMLLGLAEQLVAEQPIYAPVLEILLKMAKTDVALKDLAIEAGLTPEQAQKRIERFWQALRKMNDAVSKGGTLGAAALGIILLYITFTRVPEDRVGARWPGPGEHTPLPHVQGPSVEEIRTKALELCEGGRYAACLTQLDRAKGKDPEGDKDPKVVAARSAADKALHPKGAPKP
jgi:hypothetical protein